MARQRRRSRKPQHREKCSDISSSVEKTTSKYYIDVTSEVIMQDKPPIVRPGDGSADQDDQDQPSSTAGQNLNGGECGDEIKSQHFLSSQSGGNCTYGMKVLKVKHNAVEDTAPSEVCLNKESAMTIKSAQPDDHDVNKEDAPSSPAISGTGANNSQAICDYCTLTFESDSALHVHCQTEAHQIVVMSDGGREWKHRPPPRGLMAAGYTLCENWDKTCRYGNQCVEAHSAEELQEWCKRFEYRQKKIQLAEQQNLLGKSYTEHLLEKWSQTSNPDSVLKENVDYVEDSVTENQLTTTVSKDSRTDWTFVMKSSETLRAVALLQYSDRNRFSIKCIRSSLGGQPTEWIPQNDKEWLIPDGDLSNLDTMQELKSNVEFKHSICLEFSSDIYGTFRQTVAFDFGLEPLMVKHLCVDVRPASFASSVEELKKELFVDERWDENNAEIMKFSSSEEEPDHPLLHGSERLLRMYPTPTPSTFTLTQSTVTERMITKNNYRSRMHELLGVEEMARYQQVARYNVRSKLSVTKSYLLAPAGTAHSTAKYAQNDQLYAVMYLSQSISEDTAAGRLILNNCTSVLLCAADDSIKVDKEDNFTKEEPKKRRVFEALIEDKGKNVIYLKLCSDTVREYKISGGTVFYAEVQFQLNRLQYCEWHHAVDSIQNYKILFPETFLEPDIPWTPQRQWKEIKETKLNVKQKEAIVAITTPLDIKLPPVLIIGPFGTGKTYTLAQAIKQLLTVPDSRILVCTHSNSAADIYIHDYLHPYVLSGHEAARPLRIYYHKRWVSTVHPIVQKYSLIETVNGTKRFRVPDVEDVKKHRVIVVTLNQSMVLAALGLEKGFFTHILLDEAAQAMECEAIMPFALAGEDTRIVLAGDHMQLNPELFSPFAKERNLHMSLLERLYDHYPASFPCKILLTENYRAHEAIIKFTSDLFYEQKLVSSGRQPGHSRFYPLTFFSCRGEDVQETNSTGHYNLAEVYEIAERVIELRKCWPPDWGELNDQSIGIMTPYADQVFRIRCELRRKSLGGISVERVLNVQGKQFRAIFISTVRTRRTCASGTKSGNEDSEYGFLSNSKLLNTAITRAQSLVAVVGDPIALCSLGRCRKVWEHYIQTCDEHNSLFGMPWSTIQAQLDGVEFMPTYVLNPLAPEFIPMAAYGSNARANQSIYNPNSNEALVLNGYHSHMTYFDQSQPNQVQPPHPYQQPWRGPGSGQAPLSPHGGSNIHPNMIHSQFVQHHPQQQQLYGHQAQAQSWPVQQEQQFRPAVMQGQGAPHAYLVGTCRFQPAMSPNMMQSVPPGPVHLLPQPQRLWPAVGHPSNGMAHLVPDGVALATNVNPKVYEAALGGKVIVQGAGVDFMGSNMRGKVNANLVLNSGVGGFGSNNVHTTAFQALTGPPVQHVECQPYSSQQVVQPVQQIPHQLTSSQSPSETFFGSRQAAFPSPSQYVQQQQTLHQQAILQQPQQQAQSQGTQNQVLQHQAIQNPHLQALIGPPLSQQSVIQNAQLHHLAIQNPQIHHQLQQQQLCNPLLQFHQSPMQQPFVHEQQLRELENQLRLQQEQQRQRQQQLAILYEQRKFQLGHILTPLVDCKPEWNKLIPKGVNLLDMVDNKSQQEEWFNHLLQHGQEDLARKFAEFMVLCIRTIAGATSEHKQTVSAVSHNKPESSCQKSGRTANSDENSEATTAVVNGHSSSNHPGPSSSRSSSEEGRSSTEPVIMMKDLDPTYMLGSDPFLNGGKSVWAIERDELEHCSRNGTRLKTQVKSSQKSLPKAETFDDDDSGDELLSSINRQLNLQQSADD